MQNLTDREIRLNAIRAAATTALPSDDIGNLLLHAEWITSFVQTGRLPILESEESTVTALDV